MNPGPAQPPNMWARGANVERSLIILLMAIHMAHMLEWVFEPFVLLYTHKLFIRGCFYKKEEAMQ